MVNRWEGVCVCGGGGGGGGERLGKSRRAGEAEAGEEERARNGRGGRTLGREKKTELTRTIRKEHMDDPESENRSVDTSTRQGDTNIIRMTEVKSNSSYAPLDE